MTGLLIKLLICPFIVLLASVLLPSIYYSSTYAPIVVGLALGIVGYGMELAVLKRGTLWISTALDLVVGIVFIYLSQFVFVGSRITWTGALYAGVFFAAAEALQHMYLNATGKTKKSD